MPVIQDSVEEAEEELNSWLDSILFVDKLNNVLPVKLTNDVSDDLEGDRA